MFIVVQIPIGDVRLFVDECSKRLPTPTWPYPNEKQYLRYAGKVEKRNLGGVNNWIGESRICNSKRACRFQAGIRNISIAEEAYLRPIFRRFYFDGYMTGKFEFGFSLNLKDEGHTVKKKVLQNLLNTLIHLPVFIPRHHNGVQETTLLQAGNLLSKFYLYASSSFSDINNNLINERLIQSCPPLLFFESSPQERIQIPFKTNYMSSQHDLGLRLAHFGIRVHGNILRCWHLDNVKNANRNARQLRISLLRLNACKAGLEFLIESLCRNIISAQPKGESARQLQLYMKKIVPLCLKIPKQFDNSDLLKLAYQSEESSLPGELHAIQEKLENEICVRRQIKNNFMNTIEQISHLVNTKNYNEKTTQQRIWVNIMNTVIKGDKIDGDKVGGDKILGDKVCGDKIGGNKFIIGSASDHLGTTIENKILDYSQAWSQLNLEINIIELSKELKKLKEEMKLQAKNEEDTARIDDIASAEIELKNDKGAKALYYLGKAGKKSLDVAEKIGVGLAVAAIKTACGL
ncbi:MAG: hypothetical protein ACD_5C00224G0003 [uncultured bacterium]|nr:MAG: hypothetical protein ACD_5C00224G0003 [uncultured bacterium]